MKLIIGQSLTYSVVALGTDGNPLVPQPAFDAPPVFTEDKPEVATLSQDPLSPTAVLTGVAAGDETVSASVAIGGQTFTASDVTTVEAPAPVVAGIRLVATPNQ